MSDADKTTIKLRPNPAPHAAEQSNLSEAQNFALELSKLSSRLEAEKKQSLEYQQTVDRLQENLKTERVKSAEMAERAIMLENKVKELSARESDTKKIAELEAKVKELTAVLNKISGMAAEGKG